MHRELEQKLEQAGRTGKAYPKEQWIEIIHALLEEFQETLNLSFQSETEFSIDIDRVNSPSFCVWLWTQDEDAGNPLSTLWLAVCGGQMAGQIIGPSEEDIAEVFSVSLTMFAFDKVSKKRLSLKTGESIIEFIYQKQADNQWKWVNLGWYYPETGEWDELDEWDVA
jgi:hypothetical protein